MSGPESSPEPDDPRVEDRPLSPDVHAGPEHHHAHASEAEAEAEEGHRPSKGHRRRGFKIPPIAPALGLIASFPRRRRERSAAEHQSEGEAAPASRSPRPGLKPETRVGLAAALSFVLILGVLIARKGWIGGTKPAPIAQIQSPAKKADPAPTELAKSKPGGETKAVEPPRDSAEPSTAAALALVDSAPAEGRGVTSVDTQKLVPLKLAMNEDSTPPAPATDDKSLELPTLPSGAPAPAPAPAPATDPAPEPATVANPAPAPPSLADLKSTEPASPLAGSPPEMPPSMPTAQPDPVVPALPTAPPSPAQAEASPPPIPEAAPPPETPAPSIQPPTLETVPPAPIADPSPAPSPAVAPGSAESLGPGWVIVKSRSRRAPVTEASSDRPTDPSPAHEGPPVRDDAAIADQVEPALHTVQAGENFWTISKLYYHSSRYYKALHAANRKQVPEIADLYVGTVIRIPPPEALDRSLILPPGRPETTDGPAVSRASRRSEPAPPDEVIQSRPARPSRSTINQDDYDAPDPPARRPTYKVKANETLRSIARETLGDSKRDKEILGLNRDAIDDPKGPLPAGLRLTLPSDAVIRAR